MASYSDNNIRKTFYKRVEAPQDGFLKIIPTTGAHFFNCSYFGGVEYATNYRFETGNRLDAYEDKVSASLNRILRHNVGKVSEQQSLPCDDAGWVPIEEVLKCESIWRHDYARWPHVFLAPKGRANDQRAWNVDEANFRMTLLFKIMFHCARYGRRVREQVLAFGINKDIDRRSLTCIDNNVDADTHIPDEGLYCSIQWQFVLLRGTKKDLQETTFHCCPRCFHIQSHPTLSCHYRFVSTSPRRPTFEAFGGKD